MHKSVKALKNKLIIYYLSVFVCYKRMAQVANNFIADNNIFRYGKIGDYYGEREF